MLEDLIYKFRWQALFLLLGLGFAGMGVIMSKIDMFSPAKVEILGEATENNNELIVEVSGSVNNPNVYNLTANSRVEDALTAAGGLTDDADTEWIERTLNRAAKLIDGQKIFIPSVISSEAERSRNSFGNPATAGDSSAYAQNDIININTASKSQLESLWGIGPVTAQKIIDERPFSSVEELKTKKVLKNNIYEANIDKLTIY